ncbi:hypothetical protein JTE90_020105 [Oedothorax gibbosus]|uniref:Uncharacterized protein n=1 Tax=Oedothorax gibbosus TaxID=931172 RepID=A0AAV6VMA9_9ARAC|nr:hypothetical protein JTE90_020105 [Oedothorax gibbosus]
MYEGREAAPKDDTHLFLLLSWGWGLKIQTILDKSTFSLPRGVLGHTPQGNHRESNAQGAKASGFRHYSSSIVSIIRSVVSIISGPVSLGLMRYQSWHHGRGRTKHPSQSDLGHVTANLYLPWSPMAWALLHFTPPPLLALSSDL